MTCFHRFHPNGTLRVRIGRPENNVALIPPTGFKNNLLNFPPVGRLKGLLLNYDTSSCRWALPKCGEILRLYK